MSRQLRTLHPNAPPPPPAPAAAAEAQHQQQTCESAAEQASNTLDGRSEWTLLDDARMLLWVFFLSLCFIVLMFIKDMFEEDEQAKLLSVAARHSTTAANLPALPSLPAAAAAAAAGSSHAGTELKAAVPPGSSSSSCGVAAAGGLLRVEVCCEHDLSTRHVFTAEPQVRGSLVIS
jgi:disulfide bond formation protein DsbB